MVFSGQYKELIKICLLKGCRPMKLMTSSMTNWKRHGLDQLLKKLCEKGSTGRWGGGA